FRFNLSCMSKCSPSRCEWEIRKVAPAVLATPGGLDQVYQGDSVMCQSIDRAAPCHVRNLSDGSFDPANPNHWYCGRNIKLYRPGQPFVGNPYRIGRDGTRQQVIELYRKWLWSKRNDPTIMQWLRSLTSQSILFCHCHPQPCHCDVIARASVWARSQPAPK